jgi:hypothetical protein
LLKLVVAHRVSGKDLKLKETSQRLVGAELPGEPDALEHPVKVPPLGWRLQSTWDRS